MKASILIKTSLLICILLGWNHSSLKAQSHLGGGLRFASNINYFPGARDFDLVQSGFTTGVFGVFLSNYTNNSGFEVGFNVVHKGAQGGFNLPVVMTDFSTEQQTSTTSLEMDLKVGPRIKAINPKIGYVFGYRFNSNGFLIDGAEGEVNPWYLYLPFGVSTSWPTNFGTVGGRRVLYGWYFQCAEEPCTS